MKYKFFIIFISLLIITNFLYANDTKNYDFKIKYTVVNIYPHDVNSFTEGLYFHNGKLFESSGAPSDLVNTKSVLGVLNFKTGKLEIKKELDKNKYFVEGITYFNDKIYQLTYKSQICFVYNNSFKKLTQYKYKNSEGWGLTHDENYLIMSDGSSKLYYLNTLNFKIIKILNVKFKNKAIKNLNELEYIKGYIYANIWLDDVIVKINPKNTNVVGIIDLTPLRKMAFSKNKDSLETNGIAYDKKTDTIFVTGKMWPYVFQIKLENVK